VIRYLVYLIALYVVLPFSAFVDIVTAIVFFTIIHEDERFALVFSFIAGLLFDLYYPVRLGINTLIYIVLTQSLLYLRKYLVLNPLTTFATFIVFFLTKLAITNIILSSPINFAQIGYAILAFFPTILVLNKLNFGIWIRR
jgi:cell shape-determining protein MreD